LWECLWSKFLCLNHNSKHKNNGIGENVEGRPLVQANWVGTVQNP
jgi:hypothetical protein